MNLRRATYFTDHSIGPSHPWVSLVNEFNGRCRCDRATGAIVKTRGSGVWAS